LATGPVEVSPCAHFMMGGVRIDGQCCTSVEGLYAAGEDAAGVQGGNRLGGNGVAESTVFGALAGDVLAESVGRIAPAEPDPQAIQAAIDDVAAPLRVTGGEDAFALTETLRGLMWEKVGVVRDGRALTDAAAALADLDELAHRVGVHARPQANLEWGQALNLRSMITVSQLIAVAALRRTESRASHFRTDYPTQDDEHWLQHVVTTRGPDGPVVSTRPVRMTRMRPEPALTEAER